MNKRRFVACIVCVVLLMSNTIFAFADENIDRNGGTDEAVWTVEDFTYGDMSKRVYGCDYTRELYVTGNAITGFSEKGYEKLKENKELVIPALDPEGNQIVGIGENAFKGMGLTSVSFPTGMMVEYDDQITHKVTKRGNFVIGESAFASNELTEVTLPDGVIACMVFAFYNNKIETVRLPKTIWWIENMAFAKNRITEVDFPPTCDFQLEMHGMPFAQNFIKSVRLPDYTEVVNMHTFAWNTGMEPVADSVEENLKSYTVDNVTYNSGVVYMYTDNAELEGKDRIHHVDKLTASQKSVFQKLVVNDGTDATKNPNQKWTTDDFTYKGTVVTGLSDSGIAKRKTNRELVIPETNKDGIYVTEIGSGNPGGYGVFGTEQEGFDYVYIPSGVKRIGDYAFQGNGIKEVSLPCKLETIGKVAFQTNSLTSVILPNTVKSVGMGAFATNPKLERISLSKVMKEIEASAFGCSDAKHWMANLKSIELHNGITTIGDRAFAGNNFDKIKLPETVKTIGEFAFSTKNYLKTPCEVELNEGLVTIGADAFRNKVISEITIPETVTSIHENTFRKEYSDDTEVVVTKVYVSLSSQYEDKVNFPASEFHKIYLMDSKVWAADDFTYGTETFEICPAQEMDKKMKVDAWVVTGFSEEGEKKFEDNKELLIPSTDPEGKKIQGIGNAAFENAGIVSLTLPENVMDLYDDSIWNTTGKNNTERGDFFIGPNAFRGNSLETLELPKGVILVDENAFQGNMLTSVKFPDTIMRVAEKAFCDNKITMLQFPESTDFAFQADSMAFGKNSIQRVQLPSNTEKVHKWTFLQNTGIEKVPNGTAEEVSGGLVYMYMDSENVSPFIDYKTKGTSVVQELFLEAMPELYLPWSVVDFTYNEKGTVITGLSESGKEKIKVNANVALPNKGPTGEAIIGLGDGEAMKGIFVYEEGGKNYAPSTVQLPNTLTKVGKLTFALNPVKKYEAEMSSIVFPEGLLEIGQAAFQNSRLTEIFIPDSVTTMGAGAFSGSVKLTKVRLSKKVTEIPQAAFTAGTGLGMALKELEIPEGVKVIGKKAFDGTHVEKLILPDTLEVIGEAAFGNHQLRELEIPGSVKIIEKYAFRIMQEDIERTLVSLILHKGLETIGEQAFLGNPITEVELPETVILSHKNTSEDCIFGSSTKPADVIVRILVSDKSKVESYNTNVANKYSHKVVYDNLVGTEWCADDFIYDETTATLMGWSESGHEKRLLCKNLVLPEYTPEGREIVAVGKAAFKIPNDEVKQTTTGVDSPNGMMTLKIPEAVRTIGDEAFSQNALENVEFTDVISIGERAFYGNDLVKVQLPDTVTELGAGAFSANNITELKLSSGVTVIPQGAFSMNIRLEHIVIPNTVTEIQETAFAGARLVDLDIPKSVEKIGRKAFHLHRITKLTIPGNVKEIEESAFEGTFKGTTLKELVIEEGVEVIGKRAFKEGLLETVILPKSIKSIGEEAFLNNKGKNGSQIVELLSTNLDHLSFEDDTYEVKYIGQYSISDYEDKAVLSFNTVAYSGEEHKPTVSIEGLVEGVDFEVEYENNIKPGKAKVKISGIGRYVGFMYLEFVITENPFVDESVKLEEENTELKSGVEKLEAENKKLKAENTKLRMDNEELREELKELKKKSEVEKKSEDMGITEKERAVKETKVIRVPDTDNLETEKEIEENTSDVENEENTLDVESEENTVLEELQDLTDNNNKLIIGIVLGMLIGGSVSFLLSDKEKKRIKK